MLTMSTDAIKQQAITVIRAGFAAFGCNLDDLSDDEIEVSVVRSQQAIASAGLTVDEARRALNGSFRLV